MQRHLFTEAASLSMTMAYKHKREPNLVHNSKELVSAKVKKAKLARCKLSPQLSPTRRPCQVSKSFHQLQVPPVDQIALIIISTMCRTSSLRMRSSLQMRQSNVNLSWQRAMLTWMQSRARFDRLRCPAQPSQDKRMQTLKIWPKIKMVINCPSLWARCMWALSKKLLLRILAKELYRS